MFTGIITDIGEVRSVENNGITRFEINTSYDTSSIDIGASIAHSGACMTVTEKGDGWYAIEVSGESLDKTIMGDWQAGQKINLERSLCLGDEMGGHVVSGHVDGTGEIVSIIPDGESQRFTFKVPDELAKFIASKGSVTLNGTSLTVNEVDGSSFGVNIIPHTLEVTIWGDARVGDRINVEIDMLARYVARLNEFS